MARRVCFLTSVVAFNEFVTRNEDYAWIEPFWEQKKISHLFELELKKAVWVSTMLLHPLNLTDTQLRAVYFMKRGLNVMIESSVRTGKSTAFVIGALQRIDLNSDDLQALVLCPSEALAVETLTIFRWFQKYLYLSVGGLIDGDEVKHNLRTIRADIQVAVGTPNKIIELLAEKHLNLDKIRFLVIEDVELMFSRFPTKIIEKIVKTVNQNAQICISTVKSTAVIRKFAERWMNKFVRTVYNQDKADLKSITHSYLELENTLDGAKLTDLLISLGIQRTIIFCNTTESAEKLKEDLKLGIFSFVCVTEEMHLMDKITLLVAFNSGDYDLLVTTDLGIKACNVIQASLVVNCELSAENYLRRATYCNKKEGKGTLLNFIALDEKEQIASISKEFQVEISEFTSETDSSDSNEFIAEYSQNPTYIKGNRSFVPDSFSESSEENETTARKLQNHKFSVDYDYYSDDYYDCDSDSYTYYADDY